MKTRIKNLISTISAIMLTFCFTVSAFADTSAAFSRYLLVYNLESEVNENGVLCHPVEVYAAIDSLDYDSVGFKVTGLNSDDSELDKTVDKSSNTVFESLNVKKDGNDITILPKDFGVESGYIFGQRLLFPMGAWHNGNTSIKILPYATKIVQGETVEIENETTIELSDETIQEKIQEKIDNGEITAEEAPSLNLFKLDDPRFEAKTISPVVGITYRLNELFKQPATAKTPDSSTVELTFDNDGVVYVKDENDWTNSTVTFNTLGTVKFTISDVYSEKVTASFTATKDSQRFETVFKNTDKYIYRIGNSNNVAIGNIFKAVDGKIPDNASVAVSISTVEGEGDAQGTYTKNTSDWTLSTLRFTGTGLVNVVIKDDYCYATTIILEIVAGTNYPTGSQISAGGNIVLLGDVALANGKNITVSNIYGNGFKFDITNGNNVDGNTPEGLITTSGSIDNVKIIGAVYTTYQDTFQKSWSSSAVRAYDGARITNSYIANCRSALRTSDNVYVENTVFDGGILSNIHVVGSSHLTLKDVTTINEPRDGIVGLGIWADTDAESVKIDIEGSFKQYNWLKQSDVSSYITQKFQSLGNLMFSDPQYRHTFRENNKDVDYVNTGILIVAKTSSNKDVTGATSYSPFDVTTSGKNGYVWTKPASTLTDNDMIYRSDINTSYIRGEDAWSAEKNASYMPSFTTNYPSDYNSTVNNIPHTMEENESYTLNNVSSYINATKYGNTLNKTISVSAPAIYNQNADTITFSEGGEYTITYTFTDPMDYNPDGTRKAHSAIYTKTIPVVISIEKEDVKEPEFTFYDQSGTEYPGVIKDINGVKYAMPDVTATISDKIGVTGGVYYPIVNAIYKDNSSDFDVYYPIFKGIKIVDYDANKNSTTYNSSTTYTNKTDLLPDNLKWETAPAMDGSSWGGYKTYNNLYCRYYVKGATISASTTVSKLKFTTQNGTNMSYYYYMGYYRAAHDYPPSCVSADTLITLADGSISRADSINMGDMVLAYSHEEGKFVASPIVAVEATDYDYYDIVNLEFSDGTWQKFIWEHGLFDLTLNRYVYFNADSLNDYIGHNFATGDGNELGSVKLINAYMSKEYTASYSFGTAYTVNFFVNGMPSMQGGSEGYANIFEYGDNLQFDPEKMQKDIETYGLMDYSVLADYVSEEMFEYCKGKYFNAALGKGTMSFDDIVRLGLMYGAWF